MALQPASTSNGPGPWFTASYGGHCASCGDGFDEGDTIRADGEGGWECANCEDAGHPNRRDPFRGTTLDEMGF
jgi:hypothetical protein